MIKSMVVRNIEQHHVIIVMTLTAMDDLENQVQQIHIPDICHLTGQSEPKVQSSCSCFKLCNCQFIQAINLEARKVDPDGLRTIGVITKPDNIPEGEHEKWISVAQNKNPRQALALGYYVVMNPGQLIPLLIIKPSLQIH